MDLKSCRICRRDFGTSEKLINIDENYKTCECNSKTVQVIEDFGKIKVRKFGKT